MRVLGVHGVGNFRPDTTADEAREQLARIWAKCLARGPFSALVDQCDLDVAYYADLLREPGQQGPGDPGLSGLTAEAEDLVRAWLDEVGLPKEAPQGFATWPLRQALGWVAVRERLAPALVEAFVSKFFSEVARYLSPSDDGPRGKVKAVVADMLVRHTPQVVIAHSLGSVVAYEALWAHEGQPVDLLVTLGSPLALPHAVFPRLQPPPAAKMGRRPPTVRRWINIADVGDLVALPVGGISRSFTELDGDHHGRIHAFDFHLAANYLACTPLADTLAQELAPNADGTRDARPR
ncbi:GPI inositol-deacylase [Streptomyces sp. NBC_01715]|uniref:serine peptidase n=1 Tax=Streptomyces sp. NBC_01715 TaxID=2975916 RepID=UPI002E3236C6|nr:serine peptidase [Streptomyces sp. NBC_01715]